MNKNSLSNLIGQYMSDSENEDETRNNMSIEVNSLLDEIEQKDGKEKVPTTYWTQCMDPSTGHPYYWNTQTKDVTWEMPQEYNKFVEFMKSYAPQSFENCWSRGYSEDSKNTYYVNQYTRVVSWEKPQGFKTNLTKCTKGASDKTKNSSVKASNSTKKTQSKKTHYQSDDEKIELISSYSVPTESSSEEETIERKSKLVKIGVKKRGLKPKLVAAYATDSDSDTEQKTQEYKRREEKINVVEGTDYKECNEMKHHSQLSKAKSPSPTINIETKDFASIITGCKPDNILNQELEKLKEELEKQVGTTEVNKQPQNCEINEVNFDEKTFKRKRRIEFKSNPIVNQTKKNESRTGFGFRDSDSNDETSDKKNILINFQKSHVEFGKDPPSDDDNSQSNESNEKCDKSELKIYKQDIKEMCDIISGKVKFLLVGKPDISAVQIMDVQFETLLKAFRSNSLNANYFFKWLKETSDDLTMLEKNAAPEGWECTWDRQSSQYCYKNLKTGEIQWNFPEQEVAETAENALKTYCDHQRGEDEMDISTTPPPNEHEQIQIENRIAEGIWDADNAPPPPIISSEPSLARTNENSLSCKKNSIRINTELACFYSDIATIDIKEAATANADSEVDAIETDKKLVKRIPDDNTFKRKKRKIKVQGLGSKMKEVSSMVANWQKAQKELGN